VIKRKKKYLPNIYKMKRFILIFLAFLVYSVVKSQDTLTLSYEEAVDIALDNNVELNQNRNQLDLVKANKTEALMRFSPNVSGSMSGLQREGRFFDQTKGAIVDTKIRGVNGSLDANIAVFSGFNRIHNLKSANYALDAWRQGIERSKQDVIVAVANQYLQTLLDKQLLQIARENLAAQKALLQQIDEFYQVGTRNIVDKYDQEAQVQNQEVAVIRAENAYENDLAILAETLMLSPGVSIRLSNENYEIDQQLIQDVSLDNLYNIAVNQRPDLQQLAYQEISNKYTFKAQNSNFLPTLSAFARYGSNYTSAIDEIEDQTTGEVIPADFQYQFSTLNPFNIIGLSLEIPIWNQYSNIRQKVAAKVDYQNSQLAKEGLKRSIYTEIQTAYNDYQAAKKNYLASRSQMTSSEKALLMQRESYKEGLSNLIEVTQANQLYIEAAANQAQARFTLIFQEIILDYFTGTL
jgi:outer membrane protein